jgi:hypothetical protein
MRDTVIIVNIIWVLVLIYVFIFDSSNMGKGLNFLIPLGIFTPPLLTLYYLFKD